MLGAYTGARYWSPTAPGCRACARSTRTRYGRPRTNSHLCFVAPIHYPRPHKRPVVVDFPYRAPDLPLLPLPQFLRLGLRHPHAHRTSPPGRWKERSRDRTRTSNRDPSKDRGEGLPGGPVPPIPRPLSGMGFLSPPVSTLTRGRQEAHVYLLCNGLSVGYLGEIKGFWGMKATSPGLDGSRVTF